MGNMTEVQVAYWTLVTAPGEGPDQGSSGRLAGMRFFADSVRGVALAFHGPDVFRLLLEGIDVDHPSENLRKEAPAGRITFCLGSNRPVEAEPMAGLNDIFTLATGWDT